jgi:hypothetical protein
LTEYKLEKKGSIADLSKQIHALDNFETFTKSQTSTDKDYYAEIAVVEDLIKSLFVNDATEILMQKFIEVAMQSDLNLDSLYMLYIGKNILNRFRQDYGYKEGSYIKIWNGEEDNVVMQRILEEEEDISPKALYEALKNTYPKEG